MNSLNISKPKWFVLALLTMSMAYGQKQTKRYTEKFSVDPDVTIDINTSYVDIEFETWDKNVVEVEAIVEIEDASKEDAEKYFKNWGFEAMGNSSKVSISAKSNYFFTNHAIEIDIPEMDFDFDFVLPEIPDLEPLLLEIQEIPSLPPMPWVSNFHFDYEAYEKDGDKYLKKWKEEFHKNFDENFKKEFEEWKQNMVEHKKEWAKRREEFKAEREQMRKEHRKEAEQRRKEMEKLKAEAREQARAARVEMKTLIEESRKNGEDSPRFFYLNSDGSDKNLKVKKTIKIKMPKGAKLKMNVRHGEVKLADNTKNIKATLSYAGLLANQVSGEETDIRVSYAPILVEKWTNGKLRVDFAEKVSLENVMNLNMESNSSEVVIENLKNKGVIQSNLGSLTVNNVDDSFILLDADLSNTETFLVLPEKQAYNMLYNGLISKVEYPKTLIVSTSKMGTNTILKGHNIAKNPKKNLIINARYSNVRMEN